MSKMSLTQLVAEMQGKSLTYGWDALVLYDQRKTNELLQQLYIERVNSENGYIEPMSMVAAHGGGAYKEYIHDLKLSAPRLSFENANPSLSAKARLTLDMIGGMIVSAKKQPGSPFYISRLLKVLPVGAPQLWMDQPVTKAVVNGLGEVLIDLNNADNFKANFVLAELSMKEVGQRFKDYFRDNIPSDLKVFPLGRLDGQLNGVLTPQNFQVRVMKSTPSALMGDEQYGEGAVLLFITLKGGSDSSRFPNEQAPYLIPADGAGAKYTGTLLLSSKVLAEKIFKPALESSIGKGLALSIVYQGHDIASSLKATAGGGNITDNRVAYKYWQGGASWGYENSASSTLAPFPYDFMSGSGLVVTFKGGKLAVAWRGSKSGQCSAQTNTISGPDVFDFSYTYDMEKTFSVALDAQSNHVELGSPLVVRDVFDASFSRNPMPVWNRDGQAITKTFIIGKARSLVQGMLSKIEIPSIDTFLLRNLLFPGHNALYLTKAFVPGDLALFGEIDPLRTSTQISPNSSTVEAGSGFQFRLTPTPANITWTARDIDGRVPMPDVISSSGYFTAPVANQLPDGLLAIVVTAQGTLNGAPVESSALVTVLASMVVANPMYDAGDPGEERTFTAESVNGATLEWINLTPQWGSKLDRVAGEPNHRLYTAGPGSADPEIPFYLDKIEIKQTVNGVMTSAFIHFLITKLAVTTPMWISEASDPASGTVQFELRGKNGVIDPSRVTWKLLDGPGAFDDRTGIYRQPASVAPSSFIVVSGKVPDDFQDLLAVAAIPLPLSKYVDLLEALNETVGPPPPIPDGFRLEHNNYYPIQFQWNASDKAVKYRLYQWWVPIADITGTEYTSSVQGYNRFHLRAIDAAGQLSERTPYVYFFPPGYLPNEGNGLAEQDNNRTDE